MKQIEVEQCDELPCIINRLNKLVVVVNDEIEIFRRSFGRVDDELIEEQSALVKSRVILLSGPFMGLIGKTN